MNRVSEHDLVQPLVVVAGPAQSVVVATLSETLLVGRGVSVTGLFTTSAIVGSRSVRLTWFDKDGNLKGHASSSVAQAASQSFFYTIGLCGAAYASAVAGDVHIPLTFFVVRGGDVLTLEDGAAVDSAGDSWSFVPGIVPVVTVTEVVRVGGSLGKGVG